MLQKYYKDVTNIYVGVAVCYGYNTNMFVFIIKTFVFPSRTLPYSLVSAADIFKARSEHQKQLARQRKRIELRTRQEKKKNVKSQGEREKATDERKTAL